MHTVLEQLYDFAFLQTHPLARQRPSGEQRPGEMAGHQLRRELIDAIEALNPGRNIPFLSPRARLYHLLHMHYVDGLTVQKAANALGISLRQAHRDLRHGEETVAAIVWARRTNEQPADSAPSYSSQTEVERLKTRPRLTDIRDLLERGHKAGEKLIEARGLHLNQAIPTQSALVLVDPVIAQQVWISLLCYCVGHAQAGPMLVQLQMTGECAVITLQYVPSQETDSQWNVDPAVMQLAAKLDWVIKVEDESASTSRRVTIRIPLHKATVLVIDDNAGLAELIERYLTGQTCRVMAAHNGWTGLQMAQDLLPDVIILDVMMPDMDGWEVLQILHSAPATASIPAVICSVLHNPDLAASLGATLYLVKPIRRDDLLGALHQVGIV
ncbi:MAG: response regulator [Chloroflexi bacterium]|nr:response regulator [Chloroflexota bacterium]